MQRARTGKFRTSWVLNQSVGPHLTLSHTHHDSIRVNRAPSVLNLSCSACQLWEHFPTQVSASLPWQAHTLGVCVCVLSGSACVFYSSLTQNDFFFLLTQLTFYLFVEYIINSTSSIVCPSLSFGRIFYC